MSEPETQAMVGRLDRIGFACQVDYHSNGHWLLYAEGWQIGTPTADKEIFIAEGYAHLDPLTAEQNLAVPVITGWVNRLLQRKLLGAP